MKIDYDSYVHKCFCPLTFRSHQSSCIRRSLLCLCSYCSLGRDCWLLRTHSCLEEDCGGNRNEIIFTTFINMHVLEMKKEGRKKQARLNKQQGKATQHTQGSHFS